MPIRYDAQPLPKAEKLPTGWLKAPARIGRVGVQEYKFADGSVRRELRLPEEVFAPKSLESFGLLPVTNDHPGYIDATTTKLFQVGSLGENVRQDGDFVSTNLMLTDAKAISEAEKGKVELSSAYLCDLEAKPGVWQGQPYDVIQRNIRGNHVALVSKGRAGPEVRLRLDSEDAIAVVFNSEQSATSGTESAPMDKIRLDGVDFEVSPSAAQAFQKTLKMREDALATEKGRADVLTGKVAELEKQIASATDPVAFRAAVKFRSELETTGKDVLGNAFKADASDDEIKRAVIGKLAPSLKLDGMDAAYVNGAFATTLATRAAAPAIKPASMKAKLEDKPGTIHEDGTKTPEAKPSSDAEAYEKMRARQRDAWKTPTK